MISQDAYLGLHDQIDALARIGAIADNVTQTEDLCDLLGLNISQDSLEPFEVTMNVTDYGSLHETAPSRRSDRYLQRAQGSISPRLRRNKKQHGSTKRSLDGC